MKLIPIVALFLPILATAPALAQGTEAQRAACSGDAFRLCASSIPNVGQIAACLKRERARVSPACRTVMDGGGAAPPTVARAAPERAPTAAARPVPRVAAAPRPPRAATLQRQARIAPAARQPAARLAARAPAPARVAPGTAGRIRAADRADRRRFVTRQARGPRLATGRTSPEMAQAIYWMRRFGIRPEAFTGLANLPDRAGGLSLVGFRELSRH